MCDEMSKIAKSEKALYGNRATSLPRAGHAGITFATPKHDIASAVATRQGGLSLWHGIRPR